METANNYVCCPVFQYWLEDPRPMFFYNPSIRVYTLTAPQTLLKKIKTWPSFQLIFCPHCGTKFPRDLVATRQEILKTEYGIDNPDDVLSAKLIPHEYFTDEWWKQRGL